MKFPATVQLSGKRAECSTEWCALHPGTVRR